MDNNVNFSNMNTSEIQLNYLDVIFKMNKLTHKTNSAKQYVKKLLHDYAISDFLCDCSICGKKFHSCPVYRNELDICVLCSYNTLIPK